ncbi:MAG: hypothetical protein QOF77_2043 [Solirubrobacteraceae bacterium]|jgi:hypothetical protein|nr:hypothetical protein [Solirubrobacteraceae bacterium]
MNRAKLLSLLLVLLATAPLAVLRAAPALASPQQVSVMMDDDLLVNGTDKRRDKALLQMKSLGVEYVRATVLWSVVAAATKPGHFNAGDPGAYPHHNWDRFDNLVRSATADGIGVYFDVTGPGPRWAMGKAPPSQRKSQATWMPNPVQFYRFVHAVGKRYSGTYHKELPKDHGLLPRVSFWSIWNEPNQGGWLTPQSYMSPTLGRVIPYAPILYRRLYLMGRTALTATGHDKDFIAIGETSPTGRGAPSARNPLAPKLFIRELLCADPRGVPYTGVQASARNCGDFARYGPLKAAAWAHHPYTRRSPPTAPPPAPDAITIANLPDLTALLDQLSVTTGHIRSSSPGGLSVLASEFGYETNPPDRFAGVTFTQQATWINQGDFFTYANPRVVGMTQFLLRDAAPDRRHPKGSKAYYQTYQSGLLNGAGHRKPAYNAYMLPLVLYPAGKDPDTGVPLTGFWGQLRFRPQSFADLNAPDQVQIEYQAPGTTGWRGLGGPVMVSNGHHFFLGTLPNPGPGLIRATWRAHTPPYVVMSRSAPVPNDSTPFQLTP